MSTEYFFPTPRCPQWLRVGPLSRLRRFAKIFGRIWSVFEDGEIHNALQDKASRPDPRPEFAQIVRNVWAM